MNTPYFECSAVAQPEATITGINAARASRATLAFLGLTEKARATKVHSAS
jgi:hypothetical protein